MFRTPLFQRARLLFNEFRRISSRRLGIRRRSSQWRSGRIHRIEVLEDRCLLSALSINDVSVVEGNSGTTNAVFTVSLSAPSTQTVTVLATSADGTATFLTPALGSPDYNLLPPEVLTFNPGETSKTVSVAVNGDTQPEPNETFFVNLSAAVNATIADSQGIGTIINDDGTPPSPTPPALSISDATVAEGNSGTTNAQFTVSLSAPSGQTVTVLATTADGTANFAAPDSDYNFQASTLTFNPGETSKTLTVTVNGDTQAEANETFFVNLSSAVNATFADSQGIGTILNDDPAPPPGLTPSLSINDVVVVEGNSGTTNAVFTVSLSSISAQTVTVVATSADGTATFLPPDSDYNTLSATTLTFNPGETSKTVTVVVNGDTQPEPNETFFVNLTAAVNATLADSQGVGTILNDDAAPPPPTPPALSINDVAVVEGNSGTTNAVFTVNLSAPSGQTVTVLATTADGTATAGSDYTPVATLLTFAPGETSKTVSVAVNGDTQQEPDETFFVNLVAAVNATFADSQGVGTILNDDVPLPPTPPTISISDAGVVEGNSGTANAVFTLTLSNPSLQTVTVVATSADGTATFLPPDSDYNALPATVVTFNPGETSRTVTVTVNGDTQPEEDESFFVNLNAATNATIGDGQGKGTILNDDGNPPILIPPTVSINNVAVLEGNLGTTNAVFTVTLSSPSIQTVTVLASTSDGTATFLPPDSDYNALPPTLLTFNPGETSKTVTVAVNGDIVVEPNETFFVNLSAAVNATFADNQGMGTIINDDGGPPNPPPPSLSINDVAVLEGNAGTTNAVFTVTLSAASAQTVTVVASSADGSATFLPPDSDYNALPATVVTFNPGETSKTITVTVNGDTQEEENETFFVNLSAATNATIADNQGKGTILNDDPAPPIIIPPTISINDVAVLEGNSGTTNAMFTVTLSAATPQTVTVVASSADGTATFLPPDSDYNTLLATTLTFNPGETSKTVTVAVNGDTQVEPNETFFVNLNAATNATIADSQGMGTILNDDGSPPNPIPPTLSINDVAVLEGNAGTTNATFTVTLSAASTQSVTVVALSADGTATFLPPGSDYNALPPTLLTFNPGETSKTVTVTVNGDTTNEPDETFFVNLSAAVNATFADNQGMGTIINDDGGPPNPIPPTLSINDVAVLEGNAGTTNAVFTVTLSAASAQTVTVVASSADGTATFLAPDSDYNALPATTLTFNPGETSKTVTVTINGDTTNEPNETFFVNLNAATNATIADNQGMGTILNDDPSPPVILPPSISINDVAVIEGNSGTTNAVFTVTLSAASPQTVTVVATSSDGTATFLPPDSDYNALPVTTLTFNPGETSKTVTVTVNGDTVVEPNETFFVNLSAATNATIADNQGMGTILNDDGGPPVPIPPTLSINDVNVLEGNSGTTNAVFTITLSAASTQTVTVVASSADGTATSPSDYNALSPTTLTFNPGETSKTVTVTVKGDTINEADETFFVNLSSPTNATLADSQGKGTILNDDAAPTISINDVVVLEAKNPGTSNAVFTVILSAPSSQTITVVVASADDTAQSPTDYNPLPPTTLTFNPGEISKTVSITVNGDTVVEPNETFTVNLSGATNATISDQQGVGTIIDSDDGFGSTRMLRAYNPTVNYHFFTISTGEFANAVAHGYQDENTGRPSFNVRTSAVDGVGLVPLHRLYNPNKGTHYYTIDSSERDHLVSLGWIFEHDEGFIYETQPIGGSATKLYRLYNLDSGVHLYTASTAMKNAVLAQFPGHWVEHHIVGYAFLVDASGNIQSRENEQSQQSAAARSAMARGPEETATSSSFTASSLGAGEFTGSTSNSSSAGATLNPGLLDTSRRSAAADDKSLNARATTISDAGLSPRRSAVTSSLAADSPTAVDYFWEQVGAGMEQELATGMWGLKDASL